MKINFLFLLLGLILNLPLTAQAPKAKKAKVPRDTSTVSDRPQKPRMLPPAHDEPFKPVVIGASAIGQTNHNIDYKDKWVLDYIKHYNRTDLCTDINGQRKMRKGSSGNSIVRFRNVGDSPLLIRSATSSCGCLTAKIPREPIPSGGIGSVELHYNTDRIGPFKKAITLETNMPNSTFQLVVTGDVAEPSTECPVCEDYTKTAAVPVETAFSNWYTTKLSTPHHGSLEYFTLSCRYRTLSNNRIELELKCPSSFELEITAKVCSQTPDRSNEWEKIEVKNTGTTVTILERSNCQDGFWWWIRNSKCTSTFID
jgi:hypothetical protein